MKRLLLSLVSVSIAIAGCGPANTAPSGSSQPNVPDSLMPETLRSEASSFEWVTVTPGAYNEFAYPSLFFSDSLPKCTGSEVGWKCEWDSKTEILVIRFFGHENQQVFVVRSQGTTPFSTAWVGQKVYEIMPVDLYLRAH